MSKVSVRQPLVLYATIFMLLFASVVVTLASFSLLGASRRAYRRAITDELRAMATRGSVSAVRDELIHRSQNSEIDIEIVTATIAAAGVNLSRARDLAQRPDTSRTTVSVRLQTAESEAYLVANIDPAIPTAIALSEAGRMILPVLLGALACAALLALMMRRLLLPSLTALAAIARDPGLRQEGLVSDAPNEILEVAQTFRHTVRQLNEERERIKAQHKALEEMQANLIRASKLASVGRLAAGIAHEIGNPLAAVQGYLAILPRLDEHERKEVVERSAKELKRIHETIKKLLTYARQDERIEPPKPIATGQVVGDAILLVKGHPSFRNVEIVHAGATLDAPDAKGDAARLGQVMVNLLLNAAQAMNGGENARVDIIREAKDDALEIHVRDTGPGIPREKLDQIFDPFYTTKAPGEGTGLGLAVSRSLVEAMGGELTVESELGEGACFTIRLGRA